MEYYATTKMNNNKHNLEKPHIMMSKEVLPESTYSIIPFM